MMQAESMLETIVRYQERSPLLESKKQKKIKKRKLKPFLSTQFVLFLKYILIQVLKSNWL